MFILGNFSYPSKSKIRGGIVECNKFEKHIAKTLDRYPYMRGILKLLYQRLSYLVYHKKNFSYELHPKAYTKSILWKNKNNFEAFFRYYDKSPLEL